MQNNNGTSIIITLTNGGGALYPTNAATDKHPCLTGFVAFERGEKEGAEDLRLDAAAWIRKSEESGKQFYSISIGGIYGALFKNEEPNQAENAPNYTGYLGKNRELRVAAWRRNGDNGDYISLSVQPSRGNTSGNTSGNGGGNARGTSRSRAMI